MLVDRFFGFLAPFLIPIALGAAPVSLSALLERAHKQHPEIQLLDYQRQATEAMLIGRSYLPNPMISYEKMSGMRLPGMEDSQWALKQTLPFPLKTYLGREAFEKESLSLARQQEQWLHSRKALLTTEFFRWLGLHKKRQLLQEEEVLLSQLMAVQRTRYVSQKVSQVELVALQVERGYLLTEISSLEMEIARQKSKVESLAGPGDSLKNSEPREEKLKLTTMRRLQKDSLTERLPQANLELQAMDLMAASRVSARRAAQLGWIPDLEVMVTQTNYGGGMNQTGWLVGVEIPFWSFGEQRSMVAKAKAEEALSQTAFEEQKRKMSLETESLMAEQVQLRRQLELMENGLIQLSLQNVKSARTQYQTGSLEYASFLALIQSAYKTLLSYEEIKVKVVENQESLSLFLGGELQ